MQIANFPLRLDHDPACVFNVVERFALFLPVNASSTPGKAGNAFSDLSLTPQVKAEARVHNRPLSFIVFVDHVHDFQIAHLYATCLYAAHRCAAGDGVGCQVHGCQHKQRQQPPEAGNQLRKQCIEINHAQ